VFSYIYLDNQNHSESRQTFGLPVVGHGEKNRLWITFWWIFSLMKSTLNHRNHGKEVFSYIFLDISAALWITFVGWALCVWPEVTG
jgi:hypothetical protein